MALVRHAMGLSRPAVRGFFTVIQPGHVGWRTILGTNPTRLESGLSLNIPILHHTRKFDLRLLNLSLNKISGFTEDNVPLTFSATIFYRLIDDKKVFFSVDNVSTLVHDTAGSIVRNIIGGMKYEHVNESRNTVQSKLVAMINTVFLPNGLEVSSVEIQDLTTTPEVQKVMALQMDAERHRRKQELDTKAAINVAEGQKTTHIFESEGRLQATRNDADAKLYSEQKRAEGMKVHVDTMLEVFDGDSRMATEYLQTMNAISAYQSIATGPNTKIYFNGSSVPGLPQLDELLRPKS